MRREAVDDPGEAFGIEAQHHAIGGKRALAVAPRLQRIAEIMMGLDIGRVGGDRGTVRSDRAVAVTRLFQRAAKVEMGHGERWRQGDAALERLDCGRASAEA